MKFIEFVATAITLLGFYMISDGNMQGFTVSLVANVIWIYWGHEKNAVSLMGLNAVMIFINLHGLDVI